jgi:hypothetical protein
VNYQIIDAHHVRLDLYQPDKNKKPRPEEIGAELRTSHRFIQSECSAGVNRQLAAKVLAVLGNEAMAYGSPVNARVGIVD